MQEKKGVDTFFEALADKENFKELINLGKEYINAKEMKSKEQFKIQVSERVYSLVVLGLCMGGVVFLSVSKILDGVSASTLTGAIIGYSLAKTKSSSGED